MALDLALRSYADQLACARILDILQPQAEEHAKKTKKRSPEKIGGRCHV